MMQQGCINSIKTGVGTTRCCASFTGLVSIDVVLTIRIAGELASQMIDHLLEEELREIGAQEEQEHPVGEVALGDNRTQVRFVQFARLGPVKRPTREGNAGGEKRVLRMKRLQNEEENGVTRDLVKFLKKRISLQGMNKKMALPP